MPATYSGDPSQSSKDAVRSLCGDTGGSTVDERNEFFLSDGEIRYYVDEAGSDKQAALACAKRIKAKLAKEADAQAGDGAVDFSQRMQHYDDIIDDLEGDVALAGLNPYAGGISESDKENVEDDSDRVKPFFTREQFDNYRSFGPSGTRNDDSDFLEYFNA